jgi:hypothetical protein
VGAAKETVCAARAPDEVVGPFGDRFLRERGYVCLEKLRYRGK